MKIIIGLLVIMFSVSFTHANDILSRGTSASCGEYISLSKSEKLDEAIWSQGFMSGYNYATTYKNRKQLSIPDHDTITLFVTSHCQKNPLSTFNIAMWALIEQLGGEPVKFKYNK